jgi:hypothetical protein
MEHPITPPTELVAQWLKQFYGPATRLGTLAPGEASLHVATAAAQWGADQELEACCEELDSWCSLHNAEGYLLAEDLRAARRPKPATLNSIALQMLGTIERDAHYLREITDTIRRALEALPND